MRRFHLSKSPDLKIRLDDLKTVPCNIKPAGFWYDVNFDWLRWLEDQGYFENSDWMRPYLYELEIDEKRIEIIRSERQLDQFNLRFSAPLIKGVSLHFNGIDWAEVAKTCDGIEIAPYLWSRRLSVLWYYGWDCASGVIWKRSALKSIQLLKSGKKKIIEFYREERRDNEDRNEVPVPADN